MICSSLKVGTVNPRTTARWKASFSGIQMGRSRNWKPSCVQSIHWMVSHIAYLNPEAAKEENFYHVHYLVLEETALGVASRRVLYFPEVSGFMVYADVQNYVFSPDGNRVFILNDIYSEYYEYSLRLEAYLWDLATGIRYDMGKLEGISGSLTPRLVWSPDGESVLFFLTDLGESGEYNISVYRTVFETGEQLILFDEGILSGMDYFYLTNLYWR